jgi:hypothetical protein
MSADRMQIGRGFWVQWVVASGIGLLFGFTTYFLLVVDFAPDQGFILKTLISALGGAVFGVTVGGTQMFTYRREVSEMKHWMAPNLIGGLIGGVVAFPVAEAVGDASGFNMAVFSGGIVLGLFLGIAQAVVLRQFLSGSGWWVLAQAGGISLSWALGRGLGESVYNILVIIGTGDTATEVISRLITVILFSGGYGTLTGGVLVKLLNHNQ